MNRYISVLIFISVALMSPTFILALGENPYEQEGEKPLVVPKEKKEDGSYDTLYNQYNVSENNQADVNLVPSGSESTLLISGDAQNDVDLEKIDELKTKYQKALIERNYAKAIEYLNQIPPAYLKSKDLESLSYFQTFLAIDEESKSSQGLFSKQDSLDESTKKLIDKLYLEAQQYLVAGNPDVARDLLIHILYLDRRNFKAKELLRRSLELELGDYKIENMEAKYWNLSKINFYGGNYSDAVQNLQVLAMFDGENSLIFDRMGSNYYMMDQKKQAIDAWNTALYLDPKNKELKEVIARTQKLLDDEKAQALDRLSKETKVDKKPAVELQLMGVFPSREKAYTYAQKLRGQGVDPVVEQQSNGKWAVSIPKKDEKN